MKKFIAITATLVMIVALLRRFGPALRAWAEAKCEEMMDTHRGDAGAVVAEHAAASKDPAAPAVG